MVRAIGATPVFYETWGRKAGHETLSTFDWTNETMTWKMAAAYAAIGEQLGVDVAYAGLAFYDVYTHHADTIELYNDDLTHPSYAGSYLAAATLFAKIFATDPTTVNYVGTLNGSTATTLRAAARDAVFATPEIPAEYHLDAMGVTAKYELNVASMHNLTALPAGSLLTVAKSGSTISSVTGTSGTPYSAAYSTTALTNAQKQSLADIRNGLSVIGVEKMNNADSLSNLVDGQWGSGSAANMANMTFDNNHYDINGNTGGKYRALITLNFGKTCTFNAVGFASGQIGGLPGAVEVFVSDDGESWTRVNTACWDTVNGTAIASIDKTTCPDLVSGGNAGVVCLFGMGGKTGQYVRLGIVLGRNDEPQYYNTVNTRELLVYGTAN